MLGLGGGTWLSRALGTKLGPTTVALGSGLSDSGESAIRRAKVWACLSDSGESDKQGVPKRTRMADSPESDKRKASVRRRNYRLQREIRLHHGRATARWWHATEAMWQSAIINRKHVPHFRGQDRQSNGMRRWNQSQ